MKFLGNVLAVIVGLLVFSILSFFILAGIIAIAASGDDEVKLKENTVFVINLENRSVVELAPNDDIDLSFLGPFGAPGGVGLRTIKQAIAAAKSEERVKGIYLKAGVVGASQATLLELQDALIDFKESGKFIVAYSELYGQGGYMLSSVADAVYVNPIGAVDFGGLASEIVFLTGLFEKIGVKPEIFRVGDFKSAVEPFFLKEMSPENRLQTEAFLTDLHETMLSSISEARGIELAELMKISDELLVRNAKDAVSYGLADELLYEDQVLDAIRERLGLEEEEGIPTVNITNMNKLFKPAKRTSKNRVAVIVAEGDIVSGSQEGSISSERFVKEFRKLKKDDDIKAVVLRINSPGGSALASDVMWRELTELKKKKPLIVSMGGVAVSGGYYMAAPADTIVAQPNTITGSIGIFGLLFNAEELLTDKLGLRFDVVKTGQYSDLGSPTRKMSAVEKEIIQNSVEEGYDIFLSRVAEGRGMTKEEVAAVASGRVWSGKKALEVGLVDVLGDIDTAIEIAAAKAELEDDYRVLYYPEQKSFIELLISGLTEGVSETRIKWLTGEYYGIFKQLHQIESKQGVMARMPYDLEVR
ncbi:signal peptide peptidase SppA, 67K type [Nitritalea halalkaliphila LW7]|uniref:Signal peptide peptidase SppA, 67K type n=1 Tax=Nitritalea halalkaliphila LW7 TaxID=1189621 RepID=I5BY29_9BACT|nr:signal peptide peptidase SppA [Nitritalea halalkaliphila]EIM74481.1 signal peptide peptidase SppA, 67K type [Nitritalea halalkaliphila LW7]